MTNKDETQFYLKHWSNCASLEPRIAWLPLKPCDCGGYLSHVVFGNGLPADKLKPTKIQ